jgi:glycosyltransferase involved in cell wall biosynthesis
MISLVVPAYNESAVLEQLYSRVAAAAEDWGDPWELLIIVA